MKEYIHYIYYTNLHNSWPSDKCSKPDVAITWGSWKPS